MSTPRTTNDSSIVKQSSRSFLGRVSRQAVRAFTLIEILVVLAIAGMIIAAAAAYLPDILGDAKVKTTNLFIKNQLDTALMRYNLHMGRYPTTEEGLSALLRAPANNTASWNGPYVKSETNEILDEWKQPYKYVFPGVHNKNSYDVWSVGPDGRDGTDDDITNWSKTTATNL